MGRFYPLAFIDLNALMLLSSNAYLYFALNAVLIFIIYFVFLSFLDLLLGEGKNLIKFICVLLCILNPAFSLVMSGICYPERLLSVFLCFFIFFSYKFFESNNLRYAFFGLISANLSLYLKESAICIIGGFAFSYLVINLVIKNKLNKRVLFYNLVLLFSVGIFLFIYLFFIKPQIESIYAIGRDTSLISNILYISKGLFRFILNDSLILLLIPFFVFLTFFYLLKKKTFLNPFLDSLNLAAFLYLVLFLKLQLFTTYYYLMPMYFVCMGGIAYFYIHKNLNLRGLSFIILFLLFSNTIPQSLSLLSNIKSQAIIFDKTLLFMREYINASPSKVNIYFEKNGRGGEYQTHYWAFFIQYLQNIYNVPSYKFDVLVKDEDTYKSFGASNWYLDESSPFSIYKDSNISTPKSKDIIIVNNFSNLRYFDLNLFSQYELLYKTNYFGLPFINLISLAKFIFSNFANKNTLFKNIIGNENIFKLPINTYIFRVK